MADKHLQAREYILREIESGNLRGGDKLPGARELSEAIDVSVAITQMAFVSLTRDGVLESVSRSGTYVRHDWRDRILPGSFLPFRLPWEEIVSELAPRELPGLRVCRGFKQGMFEIQSTIEVQQRRHEYLDLAELFREVWPDESQFFAAPFRGFRTFSGELFGIPLIFSPRVIACNPELFRSAGCPLPQPGWSWEEFIAAIRRLRKSLPGSRIINWRSLPHVWMNYIFRAGGAVIARNGEEIEVMLDHPKTRNGIARYREMHEAIDFEDGGETTDAYHDGFYAGECAMLHTTRQQLNYHSAIPWIAVPFPVIPGGADLTLQATELFSVRRHVGDLKLVRDCIRFFLSEEVQNRIGARRHGIPIRKSSAIHSFSEEEPRDRLFLSEMTRISAESYIDRPEIFNLLRYGLGEIWFNGGDIDAVTSELAATLRTLIRFKAI